MALLTRAELGALALAETLTAGRPGVARGELAVVAIWPDGPDPLKQWRIVLAYAVGRRYRVAGFGQDGPAVVALAAATGAAVIVAAAQPPGDPGELDTAPVRVEYARLPRRQDRSRVELGALIRNMARRGADPETIAHLLDLTPAVVAAALASQRPAQRPRTAPG